MNPLRKKAAIAALAVILGVTLWLVLPAFATAPGVAIPPATLAGITGVDIATGGQNNDCAFFNSAGGNSYRISNPKDGTYKTTAKDGTKVSFTIDMNPASAVQSDAYANDKYVSFSSTGAVISDVGVKGGTETARFNYTGLGGVSSDGNLHGPAQSTVSSADLTPTQLYSVSQITFCYAAVAGSISGTVYQDNTLPANGALDSGDTGLSGWTLNLYDNGSFLKHSTSAADGSYGFSLPLDTTHTYKICEAPPSGTWAQSEPSPSGATICSGSLERPKGYTVTPTSSTQSITAQDFGNVPATVCPNLHKTGPGGTDYAVELAHCKTGQTYVLDVGFLPVNGKPFASLWAGDETLTEQVPMVERITWPYTTADQNQLLLLYTDPFPFNTTNMPSMKYCLLDPRQSDPLDDLKLPSGYQDTGLVLPANETSCLIATTESVDAGGTGHFVAYVYSTIDGLRTSG